MSRLRRAWQRWWGREAQSFAAVLDHALGGSEKVTLRLASVERALEQPTPGETRGQLARAHVAARRFLAARSFR